jgi:hypothetical protein
MRRRSVWPYGVAVVAAIAIVMAVAPLASAAGATFAVTTASGCTTQSAPITIGSRTFTEATLTNAINVKGGSVPVYLLTTTIDSIPAGVFIIIAPPQVIADLNAGGATLLAVIGAGGCVVPTAPPPGASHVYLCNTAYPSDANMLIAAVSPEGQPQQNGAADNPAADAVASGQWFYPYSLGPGLLSCFAPAGSHSTGITADLQGDALPTDVVNNLHSHGDARTMVYTVVASS